MLITNWLVNAWNMKYISLAYQTDSINCSNKVFHSSQEECTSLQILTCTQLYSKTWFQMQNIKFQIMQRYIFVFCFACYTNHWLMSYKLLSTTSLFIFKNIQSYVIILTWPSGNYSFPSVWPINGKVHNQCNTTISKFCIILN